LFLLAQEVGAVPLEAEVEGREDGRLVVGAHYRSLWFQVTQDQIDSFSSATGDEQWIHGRDASLGGSPFGAPIAHGLLLVSLCIKLARDTGALSKATWVLYAFDKLRFRAPVRTGSRIRCLTTIQGLRELSERAVLDVRFVVEIENQRIPALVTECSLLHLTTAMDQSAPSRGLE
jgi:acyl dehydratase